MNAAHIILRNSYVPIAQHHGKSSGERRKTGRPRGKVRASGKPVQGLLQDCEYEAELSTLVQSSLNHQISDCIPMCPRSTSGTETELLLRSHVMPLPCSHGHTSVCLSAFPTTPIMPPVVESVDRFSPEVGGIHCEKGLRGGIEV